MCNYTVVTSHLLGVIDSLCPFSVATSLLCPLSILLSCLMYITCVLFLLIYVHKLCTHTISDICTIVLFNISICVWSLKSAYCITVAIRIYP